MTESAEREERTKSELVSRARRQLAAATEDFQHGLAKVKNPTDRRKLAAAYLELMQNYLGKAQHSLTRYRSKSLAQQDADLPAATPDESTIPSSSTPAIGDEAAGTAEL